MKQGKFQQENQSSKAGKISIITILSILIVILGMVVALLFYANSKLNLIQKAEYSTNQTEPENIQELLGVFDEVEESEPVEITEPETEPEEEIPEAEPVKEIDYGELGKVVNILVVGQDAREGENHKNSDTMILCSVNKETKTLTMTSVLRDSYVKLPDYKGHTCGRNRVNVAYALGYAWYGDKGAMEMLDLCLKNNFGMDIDYNVEVNFESFEKIIDVLGGIDIVLDENEAKYMNEVYESWGQTANFITGENHMNGGQSLNYARMRHSSPADNDINRAGRQRKVIEQIVKQAKDMSLSQLNNMLDEILPCIVTDMDKSDILLCMKELLPLLIDLKVESNQAPAEGTYWGEVIKIYDVDSGVLKFDADANKKIMIEICGG